MGFSRKIFVKFEEINENSLFVGKFFRCKKKKKQKKLKNFWKLKGELDKIVLGNSRGGGQMQKDRYAQHRE